MLKTKHDTKKNISFLLISYFLRVFTFMDIKLCNNYCKETKKYILQEELKIIENIIQDKSTGILLQFAGMCKVPKQMNKGLSVGVTEGTV